jgi:Tfp pilus assembly protein PilF
MRFVVTICLMQLCGLAVGCASSHDAARVNAADDGRDTGKARELNERALALVDQDKYEQAESLLKRAVAADVMFGPARNNLGLVYYHTNRLYLAAWEFENASRLMPHHPEPRNNLGLVLERAGRLEGATESYAKARQIEPDNPEFIGNLARAKMRRGDRDAETRELLEELVLKDPRPEWTHWARLNLLRLEASPPTAPAPSPARE